jgi:hypothetical protein
MKYTDIETHARRLYDEHGPKAMAVAAQRARSCEEAGDEDQARTWRRIEASISEMRGAAES